MAQNAPIDRKTLARIGVEDVQRFADIGGGARKLAFEAWKRHGCKIDLIDFCENGKFARERSDWMMEYLGWLVSRGVKAEDVRLVGSPRDVIRADIVACLGRFGDIWRVKRLEKLMPRLFHSDSRMVIDIRNGTGGFWFLKKFGELEVIKKLDGETLRRVVLTPHPPEAEQTRSWRARARQMAGPDGFFRHFEGHTLLYIPRDPKVLVVTFANRDEAMDSEAMAFGHSFVEKQGWSMLGVLASNWTWYRHEWVIARFEQLKRKKFFKQFDRVIFYGASMGGYAAAAFSPICRKAEVVIMSPQSTLDKTLVPWETRYERAWDRDYSGPYGDAATVSASARQVTILYDPLEALDAAHVARFTAPNVVKLRCPMLGHRLASSLAQMGILSPIILKAMNGELEQVEFYRLLRARHNSPRYQAELFRRCLERGHETLARRLAAWLQARGENRQIRIALEELDARRKPAPASKPSVNSPAPIEPVLAD